MAKGTKELRQATVYLLDEKKEKLAEVQDRCLRARERIPNNCRHYKKGDHCAIKDSPAICNGLICGKFNFSVEEWIIISWELEVSLLKDTIETLEQWIVEDDYDY